MYEQDKRQVFFFDHLRMCAFGEKVMMQFVAMS
jgi:hypothetical protein